MLCFLGGLDSTIQLCKDIVMISHYYRTTMNQSGLHGLSDCHNKVVEHRSVEFKNKICH